MSLLTRYQMNLNQVLFQDRIIRHFPPQVESARIALRKEKCHLYPVFLQHQNHRYSTFVPFPLRPDASDSFKPQAPRAQPPGQTQRVQHTIPPTHFSTIEGNGRFEFRQLEKLPPPRPIIHYG